MAATTTTKPQTAKQAQTRLDRLLRQQARHKEAGKQLAEKVAGARAELAQAKQRGAAGKGKAEEE